MVYSRTDCFCNEYFSFCARDVEGLTDNEIPKLPKSCLISSTPDTTTVTNEPLETTEHVSQKVEAKKSDDKLFPNSSSSDKKSNKQD